MIYENYRIEDLYSKIKELAETVLPDHKDDLTQEVAIRLWANREKLPAKFHTSFLKRVVVNTSYDLLRRLRRHRSFGLVMNENGSISLVSNLDKQRFVSELVVQSETTCNEYGSVEYLNQAMARVSSEQRQVLLLLSEGQTYKEIADITHSDAGTVRSRIHYARKRMQKILNKEIRNGKK